MSKKTYHELELELAEMRGRAKLLEEQLAAERLRTSPQYVPYYWPPGMWQIQPYKPIEVQPLTPWDYKITCDTVSPSSLFCGTISNGIKVGLE